jgi:hypothetical protein
MAFEEGTLPFTCATCNAKHEVSWSRMPVREWQTIRCKVCDGILFQGSTVRDFIDVNLIAG